MISLTCNLCGAKFRTYTAEAKHRHNAPLLCRKRKPSTRRKDCHCFTCDKDFHHLGIARHRAMHFDKGEPCEIEFSDGRIERYRGRPND